MAYAAVISLKQTIHRLLNHSPQTSILSPYEEMLKSAYDEVNSLKEILQKLQSNISDSSIRESTINRSKSAINAFNEGIKEAASKLEDAIESDILMQQEINSFKESVKKMEDEYYCIEQELKSIKPLPEEDDDDLGGNKSQNMVGLSDDFNKIKDMLTQGRMNNIKDRQTQGGMNRVTIALNGMAGIGKTILAWKVFHDPSIQSCFPLRAFVKIGPKYQLQEILEAIRAQISYISRKVPVMNRWPAGRYVGHYFSEMKYLIVLDDVWDKRCLQLLNPYLSQHFVKGSRILVTTRSKEIAKYAAIMSSDIHKMRFMNKQESLCLLRENVFGRNDQSFPDEKAAEKIAENCEGLPLAIIAVANLLSKGDKEKLDYWKEMAKKENLIFLEVGEDMYKVLISSYSYLPQYLKTFFLYMGVFPPKCKIPSSKLIKLWYAEGYLEPNPKQDLEDFARKCLEDLASKSDLVLVHQHRFNVSGVKTCGLHPVYWYLCNKEAVREKFLHVVNSHVDSSTQGMERQRRLCIHNNVLFGIKEVHNSMESNISMARSLLCTGPHHLYPLPKICFSSRLLKVLDALTIRFYSFPIEVVELVQLRYLALTYSGKIPASISKLEKLEYLIVHRHLNIISSKARPHLPVEIWNMRKLRCLQVMGSDLIIPIDNDNKAQLSNLLTLSYMSPNSCTKEILKRTPNLKKLGIQIELPPDDNHSLHWFDHLAGYLCQLESLKCVVLNPNPRSQVIDFPLSFPSNIKKLSLSGFGYSWNKIEIIAGLPHLQVLKLRQYAFQGRSWDVYPWDFQSLKFLLLEDIDLECFAVNRYYSALKHVIFRHCYNLKKISLDIWYGPPIVKFELVDCPLASVLKPLESDAGPHRVQVSVQRSWDEKESR